MVVGLVVIVGALSAGLDDAQDEVLEPLTGVGTGDHTQMGWEVEDIEATVRELRSRGVVFEEYDMPGLKTVDGIAEIEGNYPSKGTGERGAWFRDSEGNMLAIGQPVGN